MPEPNPRKLPTAADIRRYAVESSTHPRTVGRLLRGENVQPMTRARILAVLRRHRVLHLLPDQAVANEVAPASPRNSDPPAA
jgi:hypothetical protein